MDFNEYQKDFIESIRNEAAISETDAEDEFIDRTLDILAEFDEIQDPIRLYFGKTRKNQAKMQINGYAFDETDHSLILFISDFENSLNPSNLTSTQIDKLYWMMYNYLDEVYYGDISQYCDDSDDCLKLGKLIKKRFDAMNDDPNLLLKIKFYILTDKNIGTRLLDADLLGNDPLNKTKRKSTKTNKKIKKSEFAGKPLEINIWNTERFYELETLNSNEPISIDFKEDFNYEGIPCLKGNIGENLGYSAYIAIIPGKLLADIYIEYGSKVLEGNVRAFLGTNAKKGVNRGIKNTINTEPTKFFTYNNGVAATAADIELETKNGELLITNVVDLQIINGGQTTATLAEAVLKKSENMELKGIYVPMKITVIEDRETEDEDGVRFYDSMVQNIANYANSQNKVTAADLFSNDPFHIWMEKMSKKILAPAVKYNIPTGWYYERSRKKYVREQEQELNRNGRDAYNRFGKKFPKKQIINKEQLAMYLTTIKCKPNVVSKGKNWVFKEFGTQIKKEYRENNAIFNEFYFKKCVAAAIVFRSVDGYLESNKDSAKKHTGFWYTAGGYKSDIVPYSIAKILSTIPYGYDIDWEKIWQNQSISNAFMHEIEIVTKMTNDFICDSHGVIIHEYCKKEDTWLKYKSEVPYKPSASFLDELIPISMQIEKEQAAVKEQKETNELQVLMDMFNLGTKLWNKVLLEGINRKIISYQEQSAVRQIITMINTGNIPSTKSGKLPTKYKNTVNTALDAKSKVEAEGLLNDLL